MITDPRSCNRSYWTAAFLAHVNYYSQRRGTKPQEANNLVFRWKGSRKGLRGKVRDALDTGEEVNHKCHVLSFIDNGSLIEATSMETSMCWV
jgi:hypothetical protein